MKIADLRSQLMADSNVLKTHTYMLSLQFAVALHRWTEQQQASPTIPVPASHLTHLYKELKGIAELGMLTLDIVKMIDKAEATNDPLSNSDPIT